MKKYLLSILFPVLLEIICITGFVLFPKKIVYINFIMLMGFILYYYKSFSFHEFVNNVKEGFCFWKKVVYIVLGVILSYIIFYIFSELLFSNIDSGMFKIKTTNLFEHVLFSIQVIILPCIAEELFFRQAIINVSSSKTIFFTSIISLVLFSLSHGLGYVTILEFILIGIPFIVGYIKTKNVYVVMVSHFILSLLANMPTVIILFTI